MFPRSFAPYFYVFVLLGLICYVVVVDHRIPSTKEQEQNKTRLFDLTNIEPTGLQINNSHGAFVFQKNGGHWEIKSPIVAPGDTSTIELVINQIRLANVLRSFNSEDSTEAHLKSWGLNPPDDRVILHAPDNKNFELWVGRNVAVSDLIFVKASNKDEPVKEVSSSLKVALDKELSEFRSRNVFDFAPEDVVKIASQVNSTTPTPFLSSEIDLKNGAWTLQKPIVTRAADDSVTNLITQFLALRITDFTTDDASNLIQFGLATPSSTLSIKLKSGEEIILQIGGPVPNKPDLVYGQLLKSTSVYTLAKSAVENLLSGLPNVRDRRVLSFIPSNAIELTYQRPETSFELKRVNNLWTINGDSSALIDITKMNALLEKLATLETTPLLKDSPSSADLKNFGLDKPLAKISLQLEDGQKTQSTLSLEFGRTQNNLVYVRNSLEPCVYTLNVADLNFLPPDALSLRDARAVSVDLKKIREITITTPKSTQAILDRSEGGTWSVANLKDRQVDSIVTEAYASLLSQLQAKQWLGPTKPSYGLDKPILQITLSAEGSDPVTLKIGSALPDGSHAAILVGHNTAFSISEGDFGILAVSLLKPIPQLTTDPAAKK